jgi:leucyl/phenylalanyl-tRNA---protein transferase
MIYLLDATDPNARFPPVERAEREPNGLLAVGGDLSSNRLLNAYRAGVFPWYNAGQPILWWSPDPRATLFPERLRISRSLRKTLRNKGLRVSFDQAFGRVLRACAGPRDYTRDTWITGEMAIAYERLHRLGHAHSVEVWDGEALVGGLYGVALGRAFFGESMFSRQRDASKVALVFLADRALAWGIELIDCQVHTDHLASLGALELPRKEFCRLLERACDRPSPTHPWSIAEARLGPLAGRVWPEPPAAPEPP